MPATDQSTGKFAAGIHEELLFIDLIANLKKEGFVVNATAIADFIALFEAFPDLVQLKFYIAPTIAKSEEEQQLFYEVYDEWLKTQRIYDILPPTPGQLRAKELHKKYIIWVSCAVFLCLLSVIIFTIIPRRSNILPYTQTVADTTAADSANGPPDLKHNVRPEPQMATAGNTAQPVKRFALSNCPAKMTVEPIFDPGFDDRLNMVKQVNLSIIAALAAPLTLAIFLTAFLLAVKRRKKIIQEKQIALKTEGFEAPYIIPFVCNEGRIYEEPALTSACRRLKSPLENEIRHLDIQSTIRSTIQNFTLFSPVYQQQKQDREYLILIDSTGPNDNHVRLFNYLVKLFIREKIKLTWCYFNEAADRFYISGHTDAITWDQVTQLFSHCVLIVVSNGYSFLDSSTGLVNKEKQIELQKWESRALVTPVPSADWGDSENALAKCFAVVPADLQGWELVLQAIDGSTRLAQLYREYQTYTCTGIDFENIWQLRAYLDDEDLFQWVCATAIYHHIRWELTIEIGRRILADNNVLHKLNYTSLLKIYRISWVKDGVFPVELRVKLLANLSTANEIAARKVMLKMLEHSDGLLKQNSAAFKEKAMETYINRFVLYANNPTDFNGFEEDKDVFLSLWQKGQVTDKSLEAYLKNDRQQWSTPILSAVDNSTTIKIDEYVNQKNSANEKYFTVERCIQILLCFLINFLLLQIIVHNTAKDLLLSGINKRYAFIENPNLKEEVKVNIKEDTLFENLMKQKGGDKLKVVYYGNDGVKTNSKADGLTRFSKIDGSSEQDFRCYNFTFPNIDFYKGYYKNGKIEVDFLNKKYIATVPLNCAQYLITFKQPACQPKKK